MNNKLFLALTSLVITVSLTACDYNGEKELNISYDQYGQSVQQTSDGNYIAAGATGTKSNSMDFYIAKINTSGSILWSKTYGGSGYDTARSVEQTKDGGYIVAGETESFGTPDENGNRCDFWVMKLDASGNQQWAKTYGGPQRDGAYEVHQLGDGGYIVAGYTHTFDEMGMRAYRLDAGGNVIWAKTYGYGAANSVAVCSDGSFILAGNTAVYAGVDGSADMAVVKINANGDVVWQKTTGGSRDEFATSVVRTNDGGCAIAGYTTDDWTANGGKGHAMIVKLDAAGNEIWNKEFGGTRFDKANSVRQLPDGSFIFAGETRSYGSNSDNIKADAWVVKIDAYGTQLWSHSFGDADNNLAQSVNLSSDGGFCVLGYTYTNLTYGNDLYLIKLDANGNE